MADEILTFDSLCVLVSESKLTLQQWWGHSPPLSLTILLQGFFSWILLFSLAQVSSGPRSIGLWVLGP